MAQTSRIPAAVATPDTTRVPARTRTPRLAPVAERPATEVALEAFVRANAKANEAAREQTAAKKDLAQTMDAAGVTTVNAVVDGKAWVAEERADEEKVVDVRKLFAMLTVDEFLSICKVTQTEVKAKLGEVTLAKVLTVEKGKASLKIKEDKTKH